MRFPLLQAVNKALTNAVNKSSLMIDDVFDMGHDITSSGKLVTGGFKADIEFDELKNTEARALEMADYKKQLKKDLKASKPV